MKLESAPKIVESNFKKRDTNIIKGIAIIAMVIHHTIPNNPGLPIEVFSNNYEFKILIAEACKICVSLLTIVSGYGLAESCKKNCISNFSNSVRFVLSHLVQLYSIYWCIYIFRYIMAICQGGLFQGIYGFGIKGILYFILDFLGLGHLFGTSILIGGWYITAIIVFYILFPIIYALLLKISYAWLCLCYMPWIYYFLKNDISMKTDWFLFYLFSFSLGIMLSQKYVLSKNKEKEKVASNCGLKLLVILFVFVSFILRAYITLPIDPLLSFAVIELEIFIISKINWISNCLEKLGSNSANIWLLHGLAIDLIANVSLNNCITRVVLILLISLGFSMIIEEIKHFIHFDIAIKKIRQWIG